MKKILFVIFALWAYPAWAEEPHTLKAFTSDSSATANLTIETPEWMKKIIAHMRARASSEDYQRSICDMAEYQNRERNEILAMRDPEFVSDPKMLNKIASSNISITGDAHHPEIVFHCGDLK